MHFEFATAGRILFGPGVVKEVAPAAAALGRRALVVTGATPERARPLLDALAAQGVAAATFAVGGEPTIPVALEGAAQARSFEAAVVIGMGGGSVLDAAKAIAALTTNPGDPLDYLEVIGRAQPLANPPLPVIAVPTTAGTGSEVTRNAVLASPEHQVKVSLRSPLMLPRLAVVDPLLTHSASPAITAATGLDALTQLLEPFTSVRATPMTDALCRQALPLAARSLPRAFADGSDATAREEMAFASLCGGLALANSGLGAVHGIAGPFGGRFPAPHGATCAALLAPITATNIAALRTRAPESAALARYEEAARLCMGKASASADDLVDWLRSLVSSLHVPGLATYGFGPAHFDEIIPKVLVSSSMKGNPIPLSADELAQALTAAL